MAALLKLRHVSLADLTRRVAGQNGSRRAVLCDYGASTDNRSRPKFDSGHNEGAIPHPTGTSYQYWFQQFNVVIRNQRGTLPIVNRGHYNDLRADDDVILNLDAPAP